MSMPERTLPYELRLIVNDSNCATKCWIRKCYRRTGQPNKYKAITCGGDNIKFQQKDVIIDDFKLSNITHIPHDYVVNITGGHDNHPDSTNHGIKMEYPEEDDFSTASHNSYHYNHNQQHALHPNPRRYQHLAHNLFIYPLGGVPRTIREEKAGTAGKEFTGHLAANEDPRNFYTKVKQTLLTYQVLL